MTNTDKWWTPDLVWKLNKPKSNLFNLSILILKKYLYLKILSKIRNTKKLKNQIKISWSTQLLLIVAIQELTVRSPLIVTGMVFRPGYHLNFQWLLVELLKEISLKDKILFALGFLFVFEEKKKKRNQPLPLSTSESEKDSERPPMLQSPSWTMPFNFLICNLYTEN